MTAAAIQDVYTRLAPLYDVIYGVSLRQGRRRAMERLSPRPGERILEVGVGTGQGATLYPSHCHVTAIDFSGPMLGRARRRLAQKNIEHVSLCRMDAGHLAFKDHEFDAVYAPYVINVVTDPVRVAREMLRVCKPFGRVVLLNHFASATHNPAALRFIGHLAKRATAVNWELDLDSFLDNAGLAASSIEAVNFGISSVVVCRKP